MIICALTVTIRTLTMTIRTPPHLPAARPICSNTVHCVRMRHRPHPLMRDVCCTLGGMHPWRRIVGAVCRRRMPWSVPRTCASCATTWTCSSKSRQTRPPTRLRRTPPTACDMRHATADRRRRAACATAASPDSAQACSVCAAWCRAVPCSCGRMSWRMSCASRALLSSAPPRPPAHACTDTRARALFPVRPSCSQACRVLHWRALRFVARCTLHAAGSRRLRCISSYCATLHVSHVAVGAQATIAAPRRACERRGAHATDSAGVSDHPHRARVSLRASACACVRERTRARARACAVAVACHTCSSTAQRVLQHSALRSNEPYGPTLSLASRCSAAR